MTLLGVLKLKKRKLGPKSDPVAHQKGKLIQDYINKASFHAAIQVSRNYSHAKIPSIVPNMKIRRIINTLVTLRQVECAKPLSAVITRMFKLFLKSFIMKNLVKRINEMKKFN